MESSSPAAEQELKAHTLVIQKCAAAAAASGEVVSLSQLVAATTATRKLLFGKDGLHLSFTADSCATREDLGRLVARYAADTGVEASIFKIEAAWVMATNGPAYLFNPASQLMEGPACVALMVNMLDHADSTVVSLTVESLHALCSNDPTCSQWMARSERPVERVAGLLDSATADDSMTARLAFLAHQLVWCEVPIELAQLVPLVHVMAQLVLKLTTNNDAQHPPSSVSLNEGILEPCAAFFDRLSNDDGNTIVATMGGESLLLSLVATKTKVPEAMAWIFLSSSTAEQLPTKVLARHAIRILLALAEVYTQQFLDLGGLTAMLMALQGLEDDFDLVLGNALWAVDRVVRHSALTRQEFLDHEHSMPLLWALCNNAAAECPEGRQVCQNLHGLLGGMAECMDGAQLRVAIQHHLLLHSLVMSLVVHCNDVDNIDSAIFALANVVNKVGMPYCQEYVRGLLSMNRFFALADALGFNKPGDTVFSAVIKSRRIGHVPIVVDLLVLMGVEEEQTAVVLNRRGRQRGRHQPRPIRPVEHVKLYERFRQTKTMVILCATWTVPRHRQRAVNLPGDLWRLVHGMLCD